MRRPGEISGNALEDLREEPDMGPLGGGEEIWSAGVARDDGNSSRGPLFRGSSGEYRVPGEAGWLQEPLLSFEVGGVLRRISSLTLMMLHCCSARMLSAPKRSCRASCS